jgi:hypothetical protein
LLWKLIRIYILPLEAIWNPSHKPYELYSRFKFLGNTNKQIPWF